MKVSAFIGLGANLDDPVAHVQRAIDELAALPRSSLVARSSLWRSAPVGHADQPEFVNAVAKLQTELPAEALLESLQEIELAHGRSRSFANAPRTLDLDVLLYGDASLQLPRLTIPHPRMHERAFVLQPLVEIEPDAAIPGRGAAKELLASVRDQPCERLS